MVVQMKVYIAIKPGFNGNRVQAPPPIIFTEALVLKSGSTRKFSFQEMESLLII